MERQRTKKLVRLTGVAIAARRAAAYGACVAIARQEQVGGTCVVQGCISEEITTYAVSFSQVFQFADE
ncbi:MAG TPA: hypothetical protein V6D48_20355 [Oculatellaceae cyanobacterium]